MAPWLKQNEDFRMALSGRRGMMLNKQFILKNPPVSLKQNNSAKKSRPEFLRCDVKDLLLLKTIYCHVSHFLYLTLRCLSSPDTFKATVCNFLKYLV